MKLISLATVALAALSLTACGGGSSTTTSVTGSWTTTFADATGRTIYVMDLSLTQAGNNAVSVSNHTVPAPYDSSCFDGLQTLSGSLTLNGTFNGVTANTLNLRIEGAKPGAAGFNILTLNGAVSGNAVSGAWVFEAGGGCDMPPGSGNFTMTKS
jgi:hypothetical protein